MNPHRTTDPAKRAEHIADREERLHERELMDRRLNENLCSMMYDSSFSPPTTYSYQDWPKFWLDTYHNTLPLLAEPAERK